MAVRSLEERADLCRMMMERAADRGHGYSADSFAQERTDVSRAAGLLRDLIGQMGGDRGHSADRVSDTAEPVGSVAEDEPR